MYSLLIVDGYNVINKLPGLIKARHKSMELARSELFRLIQAYCDHNGLEALIVYDGSGNKRSIDKGSPTVIYSGKGESADTVIESLVYNIENKAKAMVVTDDRVVANLITGMGASAVSTGAFQSELKSARSSQGGLIEERSSGQTGGMGVSACEG